MDGRAFLGKNAPAPRRYIYGLRDRMDERYDSVRMVRDERYRYIRNYTPHLPYAQHNWYMEEGNIMKELREAERNGRIPAGAQLYMSKTKPIEELYDVASDPYELSNLAASPAHRPILERLRAAHEKWAVDTRDVGLIPEPDLEERGRTAGTRYDVLRQPDSRKLIDDLRALVEAVNRNDRPKFVRQAASHSDPAMRYWAIVGLGKTAASAAAARDTILKAASDTAPAVRIAALAAAASHLSDDTAVAKLAAELKHPNPFVRLHAIQALDALGPRATPVKGILKDAMADENEYVKRVAAHALGSLSRG
jgi:uncharacterized sulfatase